MGYPTDKKDKNAQILEIMTQNGVAIGEMRILDFFFYTKNKKAAHALRDDLIAKGYKAGLNKQGWFRPTWSVIGQAPVQAALEHINTFCDDMWKMGATRGVEFDGWGTELN